MTSQLHPLFEETTRTPTGVERSAVYDIRNNRVRVSTRRDSEDSKSFARVEVYNSFTTRWYSLSSISWQNMKSNAEGFDEEAPPNEDDVKALLRQASLILP